MSTGSLPDMRRISTAICLYLLHLAALSASAVSVTGYENDTVILPCTYTVHKYTHHMCWGRGSCPSSGCNTVIIQTDGSRVTWRRSDRYQLLGNITQGDVSLTISEVTEEDGGTYCCRVEITGWFNDLRGEVTVQIQKRSTFISSPTVLAPSSTAGYADTSISKILTTLPFEKTSITLEKPESPDDRVYITAGVVAVILLFLLLAMVLYRWKFNKEKKSKSESTMSVINLDVLEGRGIEVIENIYT